MEALRFTSTNGVWNCAALPIQKGEHTHAPTIVVTEAYKEYVAQFGTSQSLERLCQRGGFGAVEMAILLFCRIKRLEAAMKETK